MQQPSKYSRRHNGAIRLDARNIVCASNVLITIMFVLNSVGFMPSWVSCHRVIVPSGVQKFFSWLYLGSNIFSRGYFLGLNFFLVGISWVPEFFSWVQFFFRGNFVGPRFFLAGISYVQVFMAFNKFQEF